MQHTSTNLKSAIVDDHFLYSSALNAIVNKTKNFEIVALFSSGKELISYIEDNYLDVVFMDIMMPGMNGFDVTQQVVKKYPKIKVIAVTQHDTGINVKKMMAAGAWGYITKDCGKSEYDELFDRILEDKKYICSKAAINYSLFLNEPMPSYISKKNGQTIQPPETPVTKREGEVILHISRGLSDKETAVKLNVSHRTIDAHKRNIMHKLGARKSAEIVAIAYRLGII